MLQVSEQHPFQGGNGQASKGKPSQSSADPSYNLLARLTGWDGDGGGKVELLEDFSGLRVGQTARASVRTVTIGRQPIDFSHLRKAGLRTGGFVLMRKALVEDDGHVSCRSVESLLDRETDGLASVVHGAAACILPPPPGTAMVDQSLIALARDAVPVTTVQEALAKASTALNLACTFGMGGIILTGSDEAGDAVEVMVGGDIRATGTEAAERFLSECPASALSAAETSSFAWWIVPFFKAEVDIDRSSKVSAQRANHDYGSQEEPLWSRTNAFMRTFSQSWLVADLSPSVEGPCPLTGVLVDLIEP